MLQPKTTDLGKAQHDILDLQKKADEIERRIGELESRLQKLNNSQDGK